MLGFPVPAQLSEWLRTCNGPRVTSQPLFGFETSRRFFDLVDTIELFPEWRARRWVPVAGDGCGNYFVADASREHLASDAVFFIETIDDPQALAYVVGSGVWHFVRFLLEEELRSRDRFDDDYRRLRDAIGNARWTERLRGFRSDGRGTSPTCSAMTQASPRRRRPCSPGVRTDGPVGRPPPRLVSPRTVGNGSRGGVGRISG